MWTSALRVAALLAVTTVAGCTVKETEAPPLAGPSEFALSLNVQASPDLVPQDGTAQSTITIEARGPNSQPVRALALRVEMYANGVLQDFGTLSSRTVVTGDDGRARLTYTAPPRPLEAVGFGTLLTLAVTPVGSDYRSAVPRQVDIRVIPEGVIMPPNGAPQAAFNFSPTTVTTFMTITFDASSTTDEGLQCGARCTYSWTFGDGSTGSGQITTHEWRAPGSFVVTLRVTDQRGMTSTTSQTVTVGASTAPTAVFVFSPTEPAPGQDIFFTAEASRPAPGRRIVSYDWNFGSGREGNGITIAKRYDTPGTYTVTLTVTDDANQQGTVSRTLAVATPAP